MLGLDNKTNATTFISRIDVSERISKGLCRFCGEKWDKNHRTKCKFWKKLNVIFVSQNKTGDEDDSDKHFDMYLITQSLDLGIVFINDFSVIVASDKQLKITK